MPICKNLLKNHKSRMKLSTDHILLAVVRACTGLGKLPKHLDIGAGTGQLISMLALQHPEMQSSACDGASGLMQHPGQSVEVVNLDHADLPYPDASFDLVTCTEVVEHLENFRAVVRQMHRVTKPGGYVVITTPNSLNLQSRLRFMAIGFWNLFGPLPVGRLENYSTDGHISPISYFYLCHALAESGFQVQQFEIDKIQRSALPKLLLWWPWIKLMGMGLFFREKNRHHTITPANQDFVANINSLKMLLGRTIVVTAKRSA
jgi:ubiquinone/menaquinone biosynthesis C-methylase UbiE